MIMLSTSSSRQSFSTTKSIVRNRLIAHLIISCSVLYLTQINIFQNRLKQDADEMERWDPSDIILRVFPLTDLSSHVLTTTFIIMVTSMYLQLYEKYMMKHLQPSSSLSFSSTFIFVKNYTFTMFTLFIVVSLTTILFGASPNDYLYHTLLSSFYFTILTFGYYHPPMSSTEKSPYHRIFLHLLAGRTKNWDKIEGGVIHRDSPDAHSDYFNRNKNIHLTTDINIGDEINGYIMYVTIFTTVPFQILNILDHGKQIQRWPLPIVLGCTIGHCIGSILGLVVVWSSYAFKAEEKRAKY